VPSARLGPAPGDALHLDYVASAGMLVDLRYCDTCTGYLDSWCGVFVGRGASVRYGKVRSGHLYDHLDGTVRTSFGVATL
jgi:hypothetical protein